MSSSWKHLLLRAGVCGVVLLAVLNLQLSQGVHAQTPSSRPPGPTVNSLAPVRADLRGPHAAASAQLTKPALYPAGQAHLDQEKDAAKALPAGSGVRRGAAPSSAATVAAPLVATTGTGFEGINSADSNGPGVSCGCMPPDGAVTASANYVLGAANTAIQVWDKAGKSLVGPVSLASFLQTNTNCLTYVSDPFVRYDAAADRYIFGATSYDLFYDSSVCIAVSTTNDPTGAYNIYAASSTSLVLLDFPQVAVGNDAFYVTTNQFSYGLFTGVFTFQGVQACAYDKTAMYAGGTTTPNCKTNIPNNAAGDRATNLYPAQGVGAPGVMYFLQADDPSANPTPGSCPCSTISLYKWTNALTNSASAPVLQGGDPVTTYSQPPNAPQSGSALQLQTNDSSNLGAYWYGGTLYGAHTIACNPGAGTVACIQWYQLGSLDASPSLLQQGTVSSNDGVYRFFPQLAVDSAGDFTLGYAYSSSSNFPGIAYTGRLAGDPAGTLQAESILKAGQTSASCPAGFVCTSPIRYGDFAGEALDPGDSCTVWHLEEYGESGQPWGTWIGSFRFASCGAGPGPATHLAISTPTSVTAGAPFNVTVTALDANNNVATSFTDTATLTSSDTAATFSPASHTYTSCTSGCDNGSFTFSATLNTTGSQTVTATDTTAGNTVSPATASISVNPAGASTTHFSVNPSVTSTTAGTAFNVTVTALDASGNTATSYTGTVHFTSTDSAAKLPADYTFSSSDAGVHTFGVTLNTGGSQTVSATDTATSSITGTSGPITVASFSVACNPSSLTISRGTNAKTTCTVTSTGGFNGAVALSCTGPPKGVSCKFSNSTVTPPANGTVSTTLTVSVSRSARTGSYSFKVQGKNGSLIATTPISLTVH